MKDERIATKRIESWVFEQRRLFKKGTLPPSYISALQEIGFNFGVRKDQQDKNPSWWNALDQVIKITQSDPSVSLRQTSPRLYIWLANSCYRARKVPVCLFLVTVPAHIYLLSQGKLSPSKMKALEEAGFLKLSKKKWYLTPKSILFIFLYLSYLF